MSYTPETDAFITSQDYSPTGHQWRNFTRKLERERDEARDKSERYRLEANAFMMQRDTLVQKLDAWQEIAEHLHHFVQYPAYGVDQAIQRMDVLEAYKHLKHGH